MTGKSKRLSRWNLYKKYLIALFDIMYEPILVIIILVTLLPLMIAIFKIVFEVMLQIEIVEFKDMVSLGVPLVVVFWNYLYNINQANLGYKREINTQLVNRRMKMLEALEIVHDKLDDSLSKNSITIGDIEDIKYTLENEVPHKFWISKDMNVCLESILENLNLILLNASDKNAENELVVKKEELKNKIYVEWQNLHRVSSFIASKVEES